MKSVQRIPIYKPNSRLNSVVTAREQINHINSCRRLPDKDELSLTNSNLDVQL